MKLPALSSTFHFKCKQTRGVKKHGGQQWKRRSRSEEEKTKVTKMAQLFSADVLIKSQAVLPVNFGSQNISKINSITLRGCVWAFPVTQIFQTRLKLENRPARLQGNCSRGRKNSKCRGSIKINKSPFLDKFLFSLKKKKKDKNVNFWYLSGNLLHDSQHYSNEDEGSQNTE